MEKLRAFIAVPVTDEVKAAVGDVEHKLLRAGADVKWVVPANIHITLKFLGNIRTDDVDALSVALPEALGGVSAFGVTLAGMGTFPSGRQAPRVVWVGIDEGRERLQEIAVRVEQACTRLGFEKEDRPFRPHLTIGRVRRGSGNLEQLAKYVAELGFNPLKLRIDRVNLVRSKLSPRGPAYTVLESFALEDK